MSAHTRRGEEGFAHGKLSFSGMKKTLRDFAHIYMFLAAEEESRVQNHPYCELATNQSHKVLSENTSSSCSTPTTTSKPASPYSSEIITCCLLAALSSGSGQLMYLIVTSCSSCITYSVVGIGATGGLRFPLSLCICGRDVSDLAENVWRSGVWLLFFSRHFCGGW
ncbi:unnamed protein product [Microthlaspi erraticum]|uniref:Uncharacterized protein n=1 Tax=Microthlaspi erraticum TaxID=1685480 RepID=A0A6D2I950_9BRAS|nr:unnamed protein product [Microthlaspi erraticum]